MTALAAIAAVLAMLGFADDAARAAYDRASRLFGERQYQECMNALDEALQLDPNLVPALTLRAKLAMAINRYDVARQSLERAIGADPKGWYPRFLYGFQFYQQNEMPAAIAAFEKARELNGHASEPALYLGLAYEALGRTDEALALYRRAVELDESAGKPRVEALLTLARLLLLAGDFDECSRAIAKAAKADPNSRDPHFEAGRLALRKGEAREAAREGEVALRLAAGDIAEKQVHFLLVRAYRALGRDADAERHAAALRAIEGESRK